MRTAQENNWETAGLPEINEQKPNSLSTNRAPSPPPSTAHTSHRNLAKTTRSGAAYSAGTADKTTNTRSPTTDQCADREYPVRKVTFNERVEHNIEGKIGFSKLTTCKQTTNYFFFMAIAADMDFSLTELLYKPIYSNPHHNEKIEFDTDNGCN